MPDSARVYLDNAATSYPKPNAVYEAIDHYNRLIGAPVGRGAYTEAVDVQRTVDQCRHRASQLLGAADPAHVFFTFNGTDSLNLAIHGLLEPGDHVVTSEIEHNSVLRPLRELSSRIGIDVTYLPVNKNGCLEPASVGKALRPNTKLVTLIHASNVTGAIQPIEDVGEIARRAGVLFLVDAAQTAGHLPIDLNSLPIDLLACPGHKGLLGPLGTGLLVIAPGIEHRLRSLRQGGTGSHSEQDHQPQNLPDKYESGNHNAPGLFGLEAALAWIQERGVDEIMRHEQQMTASLVDGLLTIQGIIVHAPPDETGHVGVVSILAEGFEPQVFATILDENFRMQTRAGLHCAPGAHRTLGTLDSGGTVRFSVGPFTAPQDVEAAVVACREILGMR